MPSGFIYRSEVVHLFYHKSYVTSKKAVVPSKVALVLFSEPTNRTILKEFTVSDIWHVPNLVRDTVLPMLQHRIDLLDKALTEISDWFLKFYEDRVCGNQGPTPIPSEGIDFLDKVNEVENYKGLYRIAVGTVIKDGEEAVYNYGISVQFCSDPDQWLQVASQVKYHMNRILEALKALKATYQAISNELRNNLLEYYNGIVHAFEDRQMIEEFIGECGTLGEGYHLEKLDIGSHVEMLHRLQEMMGTLSAKIAEHLEKWN